MVLCKMENQSQKKVSEIRKNDQQVEKLLLVLAFMMYLFRMQLPPSHLLMHPYC